MNSHCSPKFPALPEIQLGSLAGSPVIKSAASYLRSPALVTPSPKYHYAGPVAPPRPMMELPTLLDTEVSTAESSEAGSARDHQAPGHTSSVQAQVPMGVGCYGMGQNMAMTCGSYGYPAQMPQQGMQMMGWCPVMQPDMQVQGYPVDFMAMNGMAPHPMMMPCQQSSDSLMDLRNWAETEHLHQEILNPAPRAAPCRSQAERRQETKRPQAGDSSVLHAARSSNAGEWMEANIRNGEVVAAVLRLAPELARHKWGKEALGKLVLNPGTRAAVVAELAGHWAKLAVNAHGCRLLQQALKVCDAQLCKMLVSELVGHLETLIHDTYGNHVAQLIAKECDPCCVALLLPEASGCAIRVAKHAYGCRMLQHMLERCPAHAMQAVVDELLPHVAELAKHEYANYVIQTVLERGLIMHRQFIVGHLSAAIADHCTNMFSSNVVERAVRSDAVAANFLVDNLLVAGPIESVAGTRYGNFVVQSMVKCCPHREDLLQAVETAPGMQGFGKHVMSAVKQIRARQHSRSA